MLKTNSNKIIKNLTGAIFKTKKLRLIILSNNQLYKTFNTLSRNFALISAASGKCV